MRNYNSYIIIFVALVVFMNYDRFFVILKKNTEKKEEQNTDKQNTDKQLNQTEIEELEKFAEGQFDLYA